MAEISLFHKRKGGGEKIKGKRMQYHYFSGLMHYACLMFLKQLQFGFNE